jgi:hypothetical protein
MKKKFLVGNLSKFRFPIYIALFFLLVSCEPDDNRLGINIFPPSDTILVYTDTLYNLETQLVTSTPVFSSVYTAAPSGDKIYLLGTLQDTITGMSKAEIVTQLAFSNLGNFGESAFVDSLTLWLYCEDVEGDTTQEMRILVHEFTGDLLYENVYFSNYDVTGLYDPDPLVDEVIIPKPNTFYEFKIDNQDYLDRISQAIIDSSFAYIDSFQQEFKGFYITTELEAESNTMAHIGLANPISRLGFQYNHDSLEVSSFNADSASLYTMNFNQFFAQNVNIFHHEFDGTALDQMIDNPAALSPILYVQGMAGVNVEIEIPEFDNYLVRYEEGERISINSARLVFDVIPDSISGIFEDDYPRNLMITSLVSDSTRQVIFDNLTYGGGFGNLSKSNSVSAFLPPLYQYKFNLGLHLQSVLTGEVENTKLVLSLDEPSTSAKIIKLWSNDSDQKGSLRLELLYTRF